MPSSHEERLRRARLSLEGLSVGDAFGGFFEFQSPAILARHAKIRTLPPIQRHYTDDTNMALSIYENLRLYQEINQNELAMSFALHFDKGRGYGPSIRAWVPRILSGQSWQEVAQGSFKGAGSFGNGGAMRVSPAGAYFADDMDAAVEHARRSCEITHAHREGVAGAIAVAVATAYASNLWGQAATRQQFITSILPHIPFSEVYTKLEQALRLQDQTPVEEAVQLLGNGSRITAQDTVPFVLWCAGERLANYEEAIWLTASGGGDVDTTCAMVGGIVAMYTGIEGIPAEWIQRREPLPEWALGSE
jgi:ADP-ribosylglycohydrolase